MSTRAIQDPMQLLGFRDPVTDDVLAGGSVEFYSAGTSNAKNAWEDKDKVTPITSVTLDSAGQAQVYLDGVYKFIVKNAATTVKYTLDNLKFQARNTSTVTKTADYQATADDDYILVDTDSGAVTITLAAVAGVVAPITIKNIGSSSNPVTVDGSGAETIDGATTATLVDAASQQYVTDGVQWYGAGVATGITFTSTSLLFGDGLTSSVAGSTTTVKFDIADTNITLDEDDMASDSATHLATQQSIKAYTNAHGVVQRVVLYDGAVATGTTVMPLDDTIPQITEGDEFLTISITPTNINNKIVIETQSLLDGSAVGSVSAIFQAGVTDALVSGLFTGAAGGMTNLKAEIVAGVTTALTFTMRAGGTSGTLTFNGASGGRLLGGVANSFITVTEYKV